MERLAEDPLAVAETRPAMFAGLPYPVAVVLGVVGTILFIFLSNTLTGMGYAVTSAAAAYWLLRLLVSRDYNAVHVAWLWLRTSATALDKSIWGGSSCVPLPIKLPKPRKRQRGVDDAGL